MADEFAEAFEELLDAQEEARGWRITVEISGKSIDAIIEDLTVEEMHLLGGDNNAGTFRATCPVSRFRKRPERGEQIKAENYPPLWILAVAVRNGVCFEITAGDPVEED